MVTESGNDDIPNISTRPLLKPETEFVTEKDFEIKSGEDIDVIDTVADETSTADYEYYYVYYDEEGNMVIFFSKFIGEVSCFSDRNSVRIAVGIM